MALDYDYISSYTKDTYIPEMVDEILGSNPILYRMLGKAKKKRWGKKIIISPLFYVASTRGGSYGKWDVGNTNFEEKVTAAEFDPKYHRQFITIAHVDELENSGNEAEIVDILDSEMEICKNSFKDNLGTQIFSLGTGNDGKDMLGLRAAIDDSTAVDSYGGITRSEEVWWKAQYDYNGGVDRALTIALMQNMWGLCKGGIDSSDVPTALYSTQDIWDKFASILDVTRIRRDEAMGKAGFENILFNNKPLMVDSHCPAKYMYFHNEKHTYMVIHPDENFKFIPFAEKVDQEVAIAKVRLAAQVVSDSCKKSGVIRCIDADL